MKFLLNANLEYFLKCAEEASFLQAAYKIGITQPALSNAIKKLEEDLGAQLFRRSKKGVALTEKGIEIYHEAARLREDLDKSFNSIISKTNQRTLRIGSVGHLASRYFLDVLEENRKSIPTVHLFTSTSLDCYERVLEGKLEFAFVAWSSKPKRLESTLIAPEPVAFVGLKKAFPDLPKKKTFRELKIYPWVDLPKPQRDWAQILEPDLPGYIARDVRILRDIVLRGLAVGYLQLNFFTNEERKLLATSPAPGFYSAPGIYLVYNKNISKENRAHLETLKSAFKRKIRELDRS